jgi:xylulokinase
MLFDVAGTAAVLAGCTDRFIADDTNRALLTMRSVIPGLWHPLAYIAGGGLAVRWFRDQFYNTERGRSLLPEAELYAKMSEALEHIPPGSDGLIFSPHLGGRICPAAPEMRGAWLGFSWGHTQAHFYRAILESVAYEYAYYLKILREHIPRIKLDEARVTGGGAYSLVWNQIKANVLNVPYQRLSRGELGTWGAALVAGKASGVFPDLVDTAFQQAQLREGLFQPDPVTYENYQNQVDRYIRAQETLKGYFSEK